MPPLEQYVEKLKEIWKTQWLTNNGPFHIEFEEKLRTYLGVEFLNVFNNATIALLVALQALGLDEGEVITTPFTFPATTHVLWWNRLTPVFCDIEDKTFNIDPHKIESLITAKTKAILPVHVYGNPCDVQAIQKIADKYGLKVIYDAAHAFGVKVNGSPIVEHGDISALSFHATKLFNTIEGGALISRSPQVKQQIYYLKNFGIANEDTVVGPGINGKMNEFQAAFGLLELEIVDEEIRNRKTATQIYRENLQCIPGITFLQDIPGVTHNYAYFPILVNPSLYKMDRNQLAELLKRCNIFPRKYFYPLCSSFDCYKKIPSAQSESLSVATRVANQVLCLPLYGDMGADVITSICAVIREISK